MVTMPRWFPIVVVQVSQGLGGLDDDLILMSSCLIQIQILFTSASEPLVRSDF